MKILVVGNGGREHAICHSIRKSKKLTELYCAKGNAGIKELAKLVNIEPTDVKALVAFAKTKNIDLTIVGMDDPLMLGIVDAFQEEGLAIFGPTSAAALIEGSKVFSKDLMKKYQIPTAGYASFSSHEEAKKYLLTCNLPIVLKADGLALGKGVLICNTREEAYQGLDTIMLEKKFGVAGNEIVIEEFIEGPEISVLSFCDGEHIVPMVSATDHKRALDGDKGLNTGGMGAFSPSKYYTDEIKEFCEKEIFHKTLQAMKAEGRPFTGIIFFGIMLTKNGPKVLEYNARFGDPEAQAVLPRLKTDIVEIFEAAIEGRLHKIKLEWEKEVTVCVIMASGGYPVSYMKGYEIKGLDKQKEKENIYIYHAGTKEKDEKIYTSGGRVLGVTAKGSTIEEARKNAYQVVEEIDFVDKQYRRDIGKKG